MELFEQISSDGLSRYGLLHMGDALPSCRALISNTTLCEVSRLFGGHKEDDRPFRTYHDTFRIADLLTLLDAIVLYDELCFLPASLPDDVDGLGFRARLLEAGVTTPLPQTDEYEQVRRGFVSVLGTVDPLVSPAWGRSFIFAEQRPEIEKALELGRRSETADEPYRATIEDGRDSVGGGKSWSAAESDNFDDAVGDLVASLDYAYSGAYESSVGHLRAMLYVFMSEHHAIPYLPSVARSTIDKRFPNYFGQLARQQIYARLAEALGASLRLLSDEMGRHVVRVPPFAALAMDRAATPHDLIDEVLALRDDFGSFRRHMAELEAAHGQATTIRERLAIRGRVTSLCSEVARPFDVPSALSLQPVLRFIPDVEAMVESPSNPKNWLKLLVNMPVDRLVHWWMRRPVAKLVGAARDVAELANYQGLVGKHFGADLATQVAATQEALLSQQP